jgi:hypothetical protein
MDGPDPGTYETSWIRKSLSLMCAILTHKLSADV